MIYTLKLKGGPNDGQDIECEYFPPTMVNGSGNGTFFYLSPEHYVLYAIDKENKVAYYDSVAMANFPDAVEVSEGVWQLGNINDGPSS